MPMASIQLVDQGTLEMLVAVMFDQIECSYDDELPKSCFDEVDDPSRDHYFSINFSEVKLNKTQANFVNKFVALEDEIEVSIYKDKETLNIKLNKPGNAEFDATDSIAGST
jgi:thioredoxin-related protein